MKKQMNKGISLIVLVITIVVMIVLAATVIISISSSNVVEQAKDAANKTSLKEVQQAATLLWADAYAGGAREKADLEKEVLDGLRAIDNLNLDDYTVTVTETGVTVEKAVILTPSERYYGVANVVPTNPEYFEYQPDNTTMTATIVGIKEEYSIKGYYCGSLSYTQGISGGSGTVITDVVIPYEMTDENGNVYTITKIGKSALGVDRSYNPREQDGGYTIYTSIVLPNTITDIDEYAFHGGKDIATIVIPTSVENIGEGAFWVCDGLANVYYRGSQDEWQDIVIDHTGNVNSALTSANITYNYPEIRPEEPEVEEPESADATSFEYEYDNITMTATITGVKDTHKVSTYYTMPGQIKTTTNAITDASGNVIRKLVLPSTVKTDNGTYLITGIANGVFLDYASLENVVIPEGMLTIGDYVFSYCCCMTSMVIPKSITTIGSLRCCESLANIYYAGSQTEWEAIDKSTNNEIGIEPTITYNYTGTAE